MSASEMGSYERLRVEWASEDLLVLDPERRVVHRILARDVRAIADERELPHYAHALGLDALEAVQRALHDRRWDRRRVLASGAAAATAGITTLLLPSAVMALSVGGVAFGRNAENGSFLVNPQNIGTSGLQDVVGGGTINSAANARWFVPEGVTQIEVLTIGTNGTSGFGRQDRNGDGGSAAAVGGRFGVAQNDIVIVSFARSQRREESGGWGGAAAAVGIYRAATASAAWVAVAGGGGGGGRDGRDDPGADYVGGDGGDAGTGGAAGSGVQGQYVGAGSPTLPRGVGGGGATVSTFGAGGGTSGNATDGNPGGSSTGPSFATSFTQTELATGGQQGNNDYGGGNGGSGLFGGGAGQGTGNTGVTGGGGGGSSYLDTAALDPTTPGSTIGLYSRLNANGAYVAIYF